MPDGFHITAEMRIKYIADSITSKSSRFETMVSNFVKEVCKDAKLLSCLMSKKIKSDLSARISDISKKQREAQAKACASSGGLGTCATHSRGAAAAPVKAMATVGNMMARSFLDTYRFRSGALLGNCTKAMLMAEKAQAEKDIATDGRTLKLVCWALSRFGSATGTVRDWVTAREMEHAIKEIDNGNL